MRRCSAGQGDRGPLRAARTAAVWIALALLATGAATAGSEYRESLSFGAEMAAEGNWHEARYRWQIAQRLQPDNPRVLNNLGVAAEALGHPEEAAELYQGALDQAGGDERIDFNVGRFRRFWRQALDELPSADDDGGGKGKLKGKVDRVDVRLPVPPRLDVEAYGTLLVTSFLADASTLIDTNRELVRFLRSEFRKRTDLEVLGVSPAPAIPEQSIDDLKANEGFWQYLGREYEADLIVSGKVAYERRDASGFESVDRVSAVTGQKVRRTEFVEQEEFTFALDVLFIDAATGEVLLQDRMGRSLVFRGQQNDPITAFFELGEAIADDVLGVVAPRPRSDARIVFRR